MKLLEKAFDILVVKVAMFFLVFHEGRQVLTCVLITLESYAFISVSKGSSEEVGVEVNTDKVKSCCCIALPYCKKKNHSMI